MSPTHPCLPVTSSSCQLTLLFASLWLSFCLLLDNGCAGKRKCTDVSASDKEIHKFNLLGFIFLCFETSLGLQSLSAKCEFLWLIKAVGGILVYGLWW